MKKYIYFDNAATTALHPEVLEAMMPYMTEVQGNGSSIHTIGRRSKSAIENARKKVAALLGVSPSEIFFTSGGTESNNTVLRGGIEFLGHQHIITSPVEHHAILHPAEFFMQKGYANVHFVQLTTDGDVDLDHLAELLQSYPKALVSLMHGNNEIGNVLPVNEVRKITADAGSFFHSDMVQTLGKLPVNLQEIGLDAASGSAHKFHGPKGVGILYMKAGSGLGPIMHGGAQERNMRGGTENVAGIVGLATALERAITEMDQRKAHILSLKTSLKEQLTEAIPGVTFNGASGDLDKGMYHVLNVSFPAHPDNEMMLFNLDIEGICVSGGSACSSGTDIGSHVLTALHVPDERANIRFSFASDNTLQEVDEVAAVISKIIK